MKTKLQLVIEAMVLLLEAYDIDSDEEISDAISILNGVNE